MAALLACWIFALVATTGPATDLTFAEPTVNAGTAFTGVPLKHTFEFQNTSSNVIRITQVHTHCGCTTPKMSKLIYQPNEKGTLDLDVLTLSQPAGPHNFSAHVEYEILGVQKETEVSLKVVLVSELMIDPAKLVVPVDHVDQHPFTLRETRSAPLQFVAAGTSLPHVRIRVSDPQRNESGGWTRTITLVAEPELVAGKHEGRIDLYSADPKYGHLQAPFVLVKQSAEQVTFSPREVDISAPSGLPLPSRVIVLRNSSAAKMQIDSITSDNPAITTRWAANDEGVIAIRVQMDAKLLTAPVLESAIHINLTQPRVESIKIPVHYKVED